jgi:hypothetical protein
MMTRKLTSKEMTKAIAAYARTHGFYVRTVRTVSSLRYAAIDAFKVKGS